LQSELIQFSQNYDVLSESVLLVSNYIDDKVEDFEDENYSNNFAKCVVSKNLNCKLYINWAMKFAYTLVIHSSSFMFVWVTKLF